MARTRIVADVSSNHMGDMNIAKAMIEVAAGMGVDAVKFQSWKASSLRKDFPSYAETYARHAKTELSDADHSVLLEHCRKHGVEFLTTCFDIDRAQFLADLGLKMIKVASPDCGSTRLLERLIKLFDTLIISTGMTPEEEVRRAIDATRGHKTIFLHCISLYPTPLDKMNLQRMEWLRSLNVRVGLSDHSLGTDAGKVVIARGAEILEKHFTLSRKLPGKDQAMSTEPQEFAELCRFARDCETMEGTEHPALSEEELKLRSIYVGKWGSNR